MDQDDWLEFRLMLPAPPNAFIAFVEQVPVALAFIGLGYLLLDTLPRSRDLDRATKWALAVPALFAYTLLIKSAHMASRGAVLSSPWVVRIIVVGTVIGLFLFRRRAKRREPRVDRRSPTETSTPGAEDSREGWTIAGLVVATIILWCIPLALLLPLDYKGDTALHMGWANQLMNGATTIAGPVTGDIPSYYPWLFHVLVAIVAPLTPGGNPYHALGPLQVIQAVGLTLGLYGLGKAITGKLLTGAAAAFFGGLSGGVGFVLLRGLDLVMNPRLADNTEGMKYIGDLFFIRPYNVAFNSLAPPFPRDITFSITPTFLLLLLLGVSRKSPGLQWSAGVVLGLMWLIHLDSMLVVVPFLVLILLLPGRKNMVGVTARVLGAALATWAIWAVPQAINYFRLDGYMNSAKDAVVLPFLGILGGWGVITPFAIVGAMKWLPLIKQNTGVRLTAYFLFASSLAVVVAPLVPEYFGAGFTTLGFQHRYWPFVAMGVSLFAALGATTIEQVARNNWRPWVPVALGVVAVALAIPSPFLGSLALERKLGSGADRALLPNDLKLRESLRGDDTALNRLYEQAGSECIVASPGQISSGVFAYTGFRQVLYLRTKTDLERFERGAWIRFGSIRWQSIYDHIPEDFNRAMANLRLTGGRADDDAWRKTVDKWGVDALVLRAKVTDSPVYSSFSDQITAQEGEPLVVVWVDDCA
jgi:hypothetical protein